MHTLNTLINNPMLPLVVVFTLVMLGFVIVLFTMDSKPNAQEQARIDRINAVNMEMQATVREMDRVAFALDNAAQGKPSQFIYRTPLAAVKAANKFEKLGFTVVMTTATLEELWGIESDEEEFVLDVRMAA